MKSRKKRIAADVLIIPAADILLVSIFFIAIAGGIILTPAVPVRLPAFEAGELVSENYPVVTLTPGGGIFLDGRRVSKEGLSVILELSAKLAAKRNAESFLILKADKAVSYDELVKIIEIASSAGIQNAALAVRK